MENVVVELTLPFLHAIYYRHYSKDLLSIQLVARKPWRSHKNDLVLSALGQFKIYELSFPVPSYVFE